jgi:MSHA biogenesis protein MshK
MKHLRKMVFMMIAPLALTAGAQGIMADPTRPPGALATTAGDGVTTGGPVLQSVMLSPGRKMAMISGEMVVLGGRYGSARLVKLTESEAVLKDGAETTVLKLFPLVEKRMAGDLKKSTARTTK